MKNRFHAALNLCRPRVIACALCVAMVAQDAVISAADSAQAAAETGASPRAQQSADGAAASRPDDAAAAEMRGAQNNPIAEEMTEQTDRAISRGLEFLKSQQNTDGSFGTGRYGRNVAITALACLAFMADGHLPGRGQYGDQVLKGLEFILTHAHETGLLAADTSHGPMYGHGFAALFLGEVYGMNPHDERVRDVLTKAVRLIVNSQNHEGGWRYNPVPFDADVSVTICQIMALRSARNAGIKVPKETIDRAVDYVRACQNPDGGFKYMLHSGPSAWPRTAAGVASLFYAGIYEDDAIDLGLEYLHRNAHPLRAGAAGQAHYFYGHYYAVQAMYLAGGENWENWWPAIRDELVARQASNGAWTDHYAGGAYATGMALIILQMPKRYLPIFQK